MEGIKLLELVLTLGKGEPVVKLDRTPGGLICGRLMWLDVCIEDTDEEIATVLENLGRNLRQAIDDGLLKRNP